MNIESTYHSFMGQKSKLSPSTNLSDWVKRYIFAALTDNEIVAILKHTKQGVKLPDFDQTLLKNEAVLLQTIKLLGLMEVSETQAEFENLAQKLVDNQRSKQPIIDFDATLKTILEAGPYPKGD